MRARSSAVPSGAPRVLSRRRERFKRARTGVTPSRLNSATIGRSRPALPPQASFLRGRGRHRHARRGRGADFLPPQSCRGSNVGSGSPITRLRSPRPYGPRDGCGSRSRDYLRDRSSFRAAIPVDRAALRWHPKRLLCPAPGGQGPPKQDDCVG
ncbi:hypothetical protein NDU88_002749 [Pleurodeles waltl]|uniref:Uncharacterized protein n=1 Tax=Pleurodeles waltl TaxID=8319 RepID=A0AAV7KVK8_PLEWA|nr:hypothetical protein NDU88_002749 [Pleurodeles waltl]